MDFREGLFIGFGLGLGVCLIAFLVKLAVVVG